MYQIFTFIVNFLSLSQIFLPLQKNPLKLIQPQSVAFPMINPESKFEFFFLQ